MGYRPGGGVPGVAAGVVLAVITGWSLAWIFLWIGTRAKSAGAIQGKSMLVMLPLAFLSNAFVPVDILPGWLQTVTRVNPVSHVVSAIRDLMNDDAFTAHTAQVGWALLGCAKVAAIFIPLAVRSYFRRVWPARRCSRPGASARCRDAEATGDVVAQEDRRSWWLPTTW